jgi:hypothetical protein
MLYAHDMWMCSANPSLCVHNDYIVMWLTMPMNTALITADATDTRPGSPLWPSPFFLVLSHMIMLLFG